MVDDILDINGKDRIIVRMSLNPSYIISRVELGTSGLKDRLEAVIKLSQAGYKVGILIAPIILLDNYKGILDKDTYIYVNKCQILDENRIIKIMGKLNEEDLRCLLKSIEISKRDISYFEDIHSYEIIPIEIGDIVTLTDIERYLIIDETGENYYYIELSEKDNGSNSKINVNGKRYYLNLDMVKTLNKSFNSSRLLYLSKRIGVT